MSLSHHHYYYYNNNNIIIIILIEPGQPTDCYISFAIPYAVPGTKYDESMVPFAWDQQYDPDRFGRSGAR